MPSPHRSAATRLALDCYNLVSAGTAVPAGAFDLQQVSGDIVVRRADGTERFTPLGEPGTVEAPRSGEVIYADALGVLTQHWNHRDADRTKVTEASERILFLLETVDDPAFGTAVSKATAGLVSLLRERCTSVMVRTLTVGSPDAVVCGPGS